MTLPFQKLGAVSVTLKMLQVTIEHCADELESLQVHFSD